MAAAPPAEMKGPSGPKNPRMRTEDCFAAWLPPNVVVRIKYAEDSPARTAPNWISRCAGVQKVSRPMVMCQEMSQYSPLEMQAVASTELQRYQGMDSVLACAPVRSATRTGIPATVVF